MRIFTILLTFLPIVLEQPFLHIDAVVGVTLLVLRRGSQWRLAVLRSGGDADEERQCALRRRVLIPLIESCL